MNREIKFRAWLIKDKEMVFLEPTKLQYFDFEGSYAISFVVDGYDEFFHHEHYDHVISQHVLMQFTGLRDKNDKDIYEGDILGGEDLEYKYKVVFENGSFVCYHTMEVLGRWGLLSRITDADMSKIFYSISVIGNIHENPELLK